MTKAFNQIKAKRTRRQLRAEAPRAEQILWSKLRNKQLADLRFRRQFSVGKYVVDFYCPQLHLAIEVDGDSHFDDIAEKRDTVRQRFIESYGIVFFRCTNDDVYRNLDGTLEEIERLAEQLQKKETPLNPPLVRGETGKNTCIKETR